MWTAVPQTESIYPLMANDSGNWEGGYRRRTAVTPDLEWTAASVRARAAVKPLGFSLAAKPGPLATSGSTTGTQRAVFAQIWAAIRGSGSGWGAQTNFRAP